MKKVNIAVIAVFSLIALISCANETISSNKPSSEVQQTTKVKRTYKLKKYTQSCCSRLVEYSLKEVDGYIKSESNTAKQEITVWFDTSKCSEKDIIEAINATGYTVIRK